jgi:CcmD family protein
MSFFIAAYIIVWVILLAYLLRLGWRIRALREEMRSLAEASQRAQGPAEASHREHGSAEASHRAEVRSR